MTSSAPKGVRFLFFCSTTLVLFSVFANRTIIMMRVTWDGELILMAGKSGIIVSLPFFFRLFVSSFASTLLKERDWVT